MIETEDPQEKIRHNIAAYKAAIEAGTHTQQDLDDYLSEVHEQRTGKPFVNPAPDTSETAGDRVAGIISAGYQGATLGAGNKITAGVRTVLPQALGGVKGFDFPTALKEQTDVLDQYRQRHPVESGAVELAGGLATAIPSGAFQGATNAGRAARIGMNAAKGAGIGAFAGGAEAVRPDATAGDVATSVVKGGMLGGALGGAASAIGEGRDVVRSLPQGSAKKIVGAAMPQNLRRAHRVYGALREAMERPMERPVVGSITPAEGLMDNGMDNVLEAVKARGSGGGDVVAALRREQPMYDAFSNEAQAADNATGHSLPDVVKASQRYRTESGRLQQGAPQARFDWFANRKKP